MKNIADQYDNFLQSKGTERKDKVDNHLIEVAESLSKSPFMPLHKIIETLDDVVFAKNNLLPNESAERIMRNGITETMVENFVKSYENDSSAMMDSADPLFQNVRGQLLGFIARYDRFYDEKSLSSFLEEQKRKYPQINLYQLLDEDVQNILISQINKATQKIISERYNGMFERKESEYIDEDDISDSKESGETDPEKVRKEKRQNFILGYIFSRVLKLNDQGKIDVDTKSVNTLVEFLDGHQYPLESLYMLLYGVLKQWGQIREQRKKVRESVASQVEGVIQSEETEPAGQDFQYEVFMSKYDSFFRKYFTPAIKEVRAKKLHENLILVDITNINPIGMTQFILPDKMLEPVKKRVEKIRKSDQVYMDILRRYFNYNHLKHTEVKDEEVKKEIAEQLSMAKAQIEYTIKWALQNYPEEDPIHQELKFLPEILDCQDLRTLLVWFAEPQEFKDQYPENKGVSNTIILHQARKMIEMLLFYRKHAFKENYKRAEVHRDELEYQLKGELGIEEQNAEHMTIKYRIALLIDPNTLKPKITKGKKGKGVPEYKVISDQKHELMSKDTEEEIPNYKEGDKTYRVFPLEEKKFLKVKAHIPHTENGDNGHTGETHDADLLWYSGDGHMLHCKSVQSYLSKILRNYNDPREPKDDVRGAVAVDKKDDYKAFIRFLYENYSSGDTDVEIRENGGERSINGNGEKGPARIRTAGSQVFAAQQAYHGKNYGTVAQRTLGGKLEYSHANFELQVGALDKMLVDLSDYTVSSHNRRYTPDREFKNLFRYFFPPILYGKKIAEYKLNKQKLEH